MERTITVSESLYEALKEEAERSARPVDLLAAEWLQQRLNLEQYPELEWRLGPGGWRVGVRDTPVDVYTVVGYVHAGYEPKQIAEEMLPRLAPLQISAALRYYAEHPEEIDAILKSDSRNYLERALGREAYRRLTGGANNKREQD